MNTRARLAEVKQELEWRRCVKDERYFLQHYWHIEHPSRGRILFELRDAQTTALRHWEDHRYSLTLKARQIGWSTLVAAHQFWLAYFHESKNIIDLSRTERESVKLLRKTKYGFKHLPEWMLMRGPRSLVDHQQKMEWDNGSIITSMPSASDPARGESASLIVVDEWGFLPNPEDAWASIEPVADIGGRIIGLSTANGWGNFFHTLWVGAETGNNFFKTMFFPWSAVPERDDDWYARKRKGMPEWQLAQEYPSNPTEAFIRSGRSVFDIDMLNERVDVIEGVPGYLHTVTGLKDFHWVPNLKELDPDDPLTVWAEPEERHAYVIGADVAEGLDHGDFSSAHVIDITTLNVVAHWHGHVDPDQFGEVLAQLGWWYRGALIGCEVNNHGLTTVTALRKLGYKNIYRRRRLNSAQGKVPTMEYGWSTDRTTKPLMIDELAQAIRTEEGGLELHCADTLAELRTYVRDEKGRMGGSPFDDRVISLAIANQMVEHAHSPEYRQEVDNEWTLAWWASLGHGGVPEPQHDDWVIGDMNMRRN